MKCTFSQELFIEGVEIVQVYYESCDCDLTGRDFFIDGFNKQI